MRFLVALVRPLAAMTLLAGCFRPGPNAAVVPPTAGVPDIGRWDAPAAVSGKSRVRLVLIGDTGDDSDARARVVPHLAAERADLVLLLGDLVYRRGPRCASGVLDAASRATLDRHIGTPFGALGAPVLLVLGNHDVLDVRPVLGNNRPQVAQETCYYQYARESGGRFIMPARHYTVALGPASLAVVSSSPGFLGETAGAMSAAHFGARTNDWDVLVPHHVLHTYHDKRGERYVSAFLARYGVRPDLVTNGHAHFLQMSRYDGMLAVTSGGGAKRRAQPACARGAASPGQCADSQYFGNAEGYGYVVMEMGADDATITFKNVDGVVLWTCTARRATRDCDPTGTTPR